MTPAKEVTLHGKVRLAPGSVATAGVGPLTSRGCVTAVTGPLFGSGDSAAAATAAVAVAAAGGGDGVIGVFMTPWALLAGIFLLLRMLCHLCTWFLLNSTVEHKAM